MVARAKRLWGGPAGRRRALLGAGVVALALVALALDLGASGGATGAERAGAATATGTVARRTMAERLTAPGTIGYAGEATVLARLRGTLTWLPAVGAVVRRGEPLYAVDGEPVLLLYGEVPAYRTLAAGIGAGPDVAQLERNLAALGYEPGTVDERFSGATAAAVAAWQEDRGLEPTGELELGRVAFMPGPRRVGEPLLELGGALGGGGGGGTGGEGEAPPSTPVLRTTSTRRVVTVELDPDQGTVARRGQRVGVVLPGGAEVGGEVRRLTALAPASNAAAGAAGGGGEGVEAGVAVTVVLTGARHVRALDGATVDVRFTQRLRRRALSVPLTALLAIGGDRFAVVVVEKDGERRRVPVTPGLAAEGFVEVAGAGLREGMRVEVAA